jgi:bacterial/archaeal transporter family protein
MFEKLEWRTLALAGAFFAGVTAVLIKAGLKDDGKGEINSNLGTALRTAVVLVFSVVLVTARREWEPLDKLSRWGVLLLVLSGVATGLSWVCFNRALQKGLASEVATIDKLSVAVAIVLAWVFLREPVTWRAVVGGLLVIAGIIVLVVPAKLTE